MPFPSFNSVQEFTASAGGQIQQFVSYLFGFLSKEHKDDGSHGAITGDSLTLTGNITNTAPAPVSPLLSLHQPFVLQAQSGNELFLQVGPYLGWGINATGDWMSLSQFGSAAVVLRTPVDSLGTPVLSGAGFGTGAAISGSDYGFKVTTGSGSLTATGNVNFGRAFHAGATPALTLGAGWTTTENVKITSITTTGLTIATVSGGNFPASATIYVLVRGF
jgi:hypothetical protein